MVIDFTPFPPPPETKEATKDAAKQPADEAKPPESQPVAAGLVMIVRDLDNAQRAPWVNWIRLVPWAPWHYVNPQVEFDGSKSLSIALGLSPGGARPQDGKEINVRWDESRDITQEQMTKFEATLNPENKFSGRLDAQVRRDSKVTAEINLSVDGYPRAFVYKVPLGQRSTPGAIDRERDLEGIKIEQPGQLSAFKAGEETMKIRLQVLAPDASFRPEDADIVEVGVDEDADGLIDKPLVSSADRKFSFAIKQIDSDGRIEIETGVSDLEFEMLAPSLNKRAKLMARLALHDRPSISNAIDVIFDNAPPALKVDARDAVVHRGETLKLSVTAVDQDPEGAEASGVKSVFYVVDKRKLDAQVKEKPLQIEAPDPETGKWVLNYEPPPGLSLGQHPLLFWASDNVGWTSASRVGDHHGPGSAAA